MDYQEAIGNGEILRNARKKLSWTQRDLADYFEISQRVIISYWEQGTRAIPDAVLKMAKRVKRMSKKTTRECYILLGKKSPAQASVEDIVLDSNLLHSLEEKNTQKVVVSDFLDKILPNTTIKHILETYITFKKSTGRFPTAGDFLSETFKEMTQKEVLEHFDCLSTAKRLAGELMRSRRATRRKEKTIPTFKPPEATEIKRNIQTAITYIDPNDENNWLKALYPERNFDTFKSKVKQRNFTWKELFKYRPESERLVITDT